ncbi:MAG: hypothetical protein U0903_19040 [Planctomycetales bacterium]
MARTRERSRKNCLAVQAAPAKLQAAKSGAILPAFTAARFGVQRELLNLIEASGLPFATTSSIKR